MALAFAATAFCAWRMYKPGSFARNLPPGTLPFVAFLVYATIQIPRAAVPYDAHLEVLKLASYFCAYWVWNQLAGVHGRWRWLIAGFLLVVTMMAWYAIIQHAHGSRMVLNLARPTDYGMRASGAYFCPNHFANLLEMMIPFALAVVLAPSSGLPLRMLAGYSVLVALPPLYLSQSRSGWIGVFTGLSVTIAMLGLRRSFRRFLLFALLSPLLFMAIGAIVWFLSPMVQIRVADALAGNVRIHLWQDTWAMIQQKLWWGWGPYSYRWVYPRFWHFVKIYVDPQFSHNDYLQLWAEYGLAGALLLLSACAAVIIRLLARMRKLEGDRDAYLIAGLLGAVAASCAHACFDYNFHLYGNVHALVMMAGVVTALVFAGDGRIVESGVRATALRFGAVCAVLFFLFLAAVSVRSVASYLLVRKGNEAREAFEMDRALSLYKKAARISPENWNASLGLGHTWGALAFWNRDPASRPLQIESALEMYKRARAGNAWDSEALFGMSRMYNAQGHPELALAALQEVVAGAPYHRDFLLQLGAQLRLMGRDQDALDTFIKARQMGASEMADLNIQSLTKKIQQNAIGN